MVIPLFSIIITLAIVGLILWAITQLPIDAQIVKIIRVIVIVLACIWVLNLFLGGTHGGIRFSGMTTYGLHLV